MTGPQDTSPWASDEPRLRGGVDRLLELTFGPRQSHADCGQRRARAFLKLSSQSGGDDAGTAGSAEGRMDNPGLALRYDSSLASSHTTVANALPQRQGRLSGASLWLGAGFPT